MCPPQTLLTPCAPSSTPALHARSPRPLCAVQGDLIVLIAAAFSLGTALDQTGAAKEIADSLIDLLAPLGGAGILAGYDDVV